MSLKTWVSYLSDKNLPVGFQSGSALREAVKDSRSNVSSVAQLLKHDPVVLYYIMRALGQVSLSRNQKELQTLEQVVSQLGFDRMIGITEKFELLEPFSLQEKHYYAVMLQMSMHAGIQVREWGTYQHSIRTDILFAAGIMQDMASWYFAFFKPEMIESMYQRAQEEEIPLETIEQETIGCTFEELSYELAVLWKFPQFLIDCIFPEKADRLALITFQPQRDPQDIAIQMKLQDIKNQETIMANTAGKIARDITYRGWSFKYLKEQLEKVSIYLNLDMEYTCKLIRKAAIIASREYTVGGVCAPAASLLYSEGEAKERGVLDALQDKAYFALEKENIKNPDPSKGQYQDLVKTTLIAITQGIGLERAIALLVDTQKNKLIVKYHQGLVSDDRLKDLTVHIDEKNLFTILMKANKTIWVDSHNYKEFEALFPTPARELGVLMYFFAVPITIQNKGIGLIVCDRTNKKGKALTGEQYAAFKEIAAALMEGLKVFFEKAQKKGEKDGKTQDIPRPTVSNDPQ